MLVVPGEGCRAVQHQKELSCITFLQTQGSLPSPTSLYPLTDHHKWLPFAALSSAHGLPLWFLTSPLALISFWKILTIVAMLIA